ncbi:MAG TPA: LPS export ABC transporter periplasmic protein LptC [Bryobacteraceae bacterium]|nr:LPS export ABC transporter periplasmic protein LptC [Bryobacteraceae bacterium]
MRRTRWLFLAAILVIVVAVGATYLNRKATYDQNAPVAPPALDLTLDAQSQIWHTGKFDKESGRPIWKLRAKQARELKQPPVTQLEGVELELYDKEATQYDLIKSEKAQFDAKAKTMFSDGDVQIDLNIPVEGPPHGHQVKIHTSGVTFESETGRATTERKTAFQFDQGGGTSMGADYDPQIRELHMHSQVSLDWRGKTPDSAPMHIESGEAYYKEKESKVLLLPWSKLKRDTLTMEGAMAVVVLDEGEVREATLIQGRGIRDDSDRQVEFGADQLHLHFVDGMVVDKIEGEHNGRLVSNAQTMKTTVTGDHLDLAFDTSNKDSTLTGVIATGGGKAEAVPLPRPDKELAETRILHSETIRLKMKQGGKDIDAVETAGPGTLDFLPNRPGQPKRWMKGDRIWIAYGTENRIQSFKSINVSTRTDKPPQPNQPVPPPALTESKELFATFDPKTSDLSRMEQKTDFRYQEGDRRARANLAILEQDKDLMTLDGAARVWDPTGSASGDRIVTNQKTGDFKADGHVASTHQPDKNGNSSAMLSTDEVLQARAQHMVSTDNNQKIHYEGNAVAWQGANRVEADRLDIDRDNQIMEAHGKVKSQFVDKDKDQDKDADNESAAPTKPAAAPIFTIVTAPDMVYREENRVVDYTGGVTLQRPDMVVTAKQIRAFLKDADEDSTLDKAMADGTVKIVSTSLKLKRTRTGTAEHAEYYADNEKVILQGGEPQLMDNQGQKTRGKQLTWFANDDRLFVDGADLKNPAKSTIRKKK